MPSKPGPNRFVKYGVLWPNTIDPIAMEWDMVRHGGQWKDKRGIVVGKGLPFHFRRFQELIWPEKVWHKWSVLMMESYLTHRTMGVIGAASTGKTHCAATDVLADWFCFPECTTVLCCSTTHERLEDRVWGEIKKWFKKAQENCHWLDGYLIEGRQRILVDEKLSTQDGRDFRNGLIGVACFFSDSQVDTPCGPRRIDSLRVGDVVINATGSGRIKETHNRVASSLVRIKLSDGRAIDCTPEHPILTRRGWIKAIDLETFDTVLSAHETLRIMRKENVSLVSKQKVLLNPMRQLLGSKVLRLLRKRISSVASAISEWPFMEGKKHWPILQSAMCWNVGIQTQRVLEKEKQALQTLRHTYDRCSLFERLLLSRLSHSSRNIAVSAMRESIYINSRESQKASDSFLRETLQRESDRPCLQPKEGAANSGRIIGLETVSRLNRKTPHTHRAKVLGWGRSLVSGRHSVSSNKTYRGSGWWNPFKAGQEREGRKAHTNTQWTWVDSVEILESRSDQRFDQSKGGYPVHNLEVEGHPSYSVNGVIVHNCKRGENFVGISDFVGVKNKRVRVLADELSLLPRGFVDAISNLDKNPDFKAVGLGNPKETTDALGVFCEPAAHLGGWDGGIDQIPGTKTWETRRPNGICIQLPGSDSPNLDGKLGIPLITQEQIDRDVAFYGKDSVWYWMMNEGRMPRGQGSRRVLTRQMCHKFRAMEEPVWLNSNRTPIAFLDAAYRGVGGDRCVFGVLLFGEEAGAPVETSAGNLVTQILPSTTGRKILALLETMVVPIVGGINDQPEDQIVQFVMNQCQSRNIPAENFYFDSGMRTSLVTAFSRIWTPAVNSVDCGGRASDRRVSSDINVLCKDYYSKFITELWFNVRLTVEAGQFRGMTEDVMMEFAAREWTMVGANKIEVEPKWAMKEKTGRSPDLADAVAVGLYGAIQRGFEIARLKSEHRRPASDEWKRRLKERAEALRESKQLNYAA